MDDHAAVPDGHAAYRPFVPLLAAVAAVSAVVGDPGSGADNALVLAAIAPFSVWWLIPRLPILVLVGATAVATQVATRDGNLEAAMFLLSIAATVVGAYERSSVRFVIGGLALLAVPIIGVVAFDNDSAAGVWTMGIVLPLVLTRVGRRQDELAHELARTRAVVADQRVMEERRRIARDVHDSVGHGLAAVLLHITGARHVLGRDPEAADHALAEAEAVGRASMRELRETLGILRTEPHLGPLPPVPDLADVARDDVWRRFDVVGDVGRIDALVGTSLHRVAQEAFANAGRHAPDSPAKALLDIRDDDVVMTIETFGQPSDQASDRTSDPMSDNERRPGYGIVGMSERMAAIGGTLDVGPTPLGWLVRASVPIVRAEPS